jgi:nitrite reductase (NAD(P)H)
MYAYLREVDMPSVLIRLPPGPMHKRNYELKTGDCLNDDEYSIIAFEVRADGDEELDAVMGTNKWLVRQATAEMIDRSSGGGVEIVGPDDENERGGAGGTQFGKAAKFEEPPCAGGKLEW